MNEQCSICLQDIINRDTCLTNCQHRYCVSCLDLWFDRGQSSCPMCRGRIRYITYNNESHRIIFNRINNELAPRPLVHRQGNNVIISKQLYVLMKASYVILSAFVIFPLLMYVDIRKDYSVQIDLLQECRDSL